MTIWLPQLEPGKALYLAIADAMQRDIVLGTLKAGDKLPPHRDLAWRLKVTVGTVTRAYREAEIRGLLSGEVGRGSYVRQQTGKPTIPSRAESESALMDLRHAVPPRLMLKEEFDAALAHVLREPERLQLLDYNPPEGDWRQRQMGQKWLLRCGISVSDQDVVVCAGAHVGLISVLLEIAEQGETVMAEQLNYPSLKPSLRSLGVRTLALPMDAHGLIPEALEKAASTGEARLVYLVPTLHNPTTTTMPRERREAIVAIARRHDLTLLEDDIFRLLDPRVQPPTFYSLAPERTFYITSLSKVLAPGMRVGFVATPTGRGKLLTENQKIASGRSVGMTTEMARYWLETDIADSVIRRAQSELAVRRQIFLDVFQGQPLRCEPGAMFGWLALPEQWTASRFCQELEVQGIAINPGGVFALPPYSESSHVRICFGPADSPVALKEGLQKIRQLMARAPTMRDFMPVA